MSVYFSFVGFWKFGSKGVDVIEICGTGAGRLYRLAWTYEDFLVVVVSFVVFFEVGF